MACARMSIFRRKRALVPLALMLLFCFASPYLARARTVEIDSGFRFASAAAIPGSSAAIADFNSDAKPDFAIADRIGSGAQGYTYSLAVGLSLETSQVFHFRSPHPSLSVSVLDLDNDQDLDVVLTRTFTGDVVGVWINNGRGQFHEGNAADFLRVLPANEHKGTLASAHSFLNAPALPLRKFRALRPAHISLDSLPVPSRAAVEIPEIHRAQDISRSSTAPRAPPISHS
jgi:hypothetical protein